MAESCGSFRYRPRDLVKGPLFRVVLDHLEEFAVRLAWPVDSRPRPHPRIVERFRKYIACGLSRFGVVRFRCPKCGEDIFVAFSCMFSLMAGLLGQKSDTLSRSAGGAYA